MYFCTLIIPDVWNVETYVASDKRDLSESLATLDELYYEQFDDNSTLIEKFKSVKLRVLDRKIGENLKQLYDYRCQVCGEAIWLPYGDQPIVDAHHIS